MLFLIVFITSSAAHTSLRYIATENYDDYRSSWSINRGHASGHGHEYQRANEYPRTHSDMNFNGQGASVNIHRQVATKYNNQYPYRSGNGQWNRMTDTANRFEPRNTFDSENRQLNNQAINFNTPVEQNRYAQAYNAGNNKGENTPFNVNTKTNNNLNYYNDTVYTNIKNTEQTTSSNRQRGLSSDGLVNKTVTIRDKEAKIYVSQLNSSNDTSSRNNSTGRSWDNNRTKVAEDNNGASTDGDRAGNTEEDRWIWSDGNEVETTTLMALDDRAAFGGSSCPSGMIRFKNACVTPD